jgi:N-acetylglucosaminyldiphosphoundecaprenol N-acetyl-beta-D-mannosaminyltransferase
MREILGVRLNGLNYRDTAERCVTWAQHGESRTIIFANVHMIMEAHYDRSLHCLLNDADILNPDGMPLVWALRMFGYKDAERVYGPDATLVVLAAAEAAGIPVGFYGGLPETMEMLLAEARNRFPKLKIVFRYSPPFHPLNFKEDEDLVSAIGESGLKMLFVGLGCPKQERWIMDHRGRIYAVMLAVGAAFDFLAKTKRQAPRWMMRSGLEWAFRFGSEPSRLAGRYFKHNPRYVTLILFQWLRLRKSRVQH